MNILYVSSLCSSEMLGKLFSTANEKPHPAPQKFHSLMVAGLVENGQDVTCLVARPVTVRSHPSKKWWKRESEEVGGVRYIYLPFLNLTAVGKLCFIFFAFFYTLSWILRTKGSKAMICDVLTYHSLSSMAACRMLRVKTVGIVTDIPGQLTVQQHSSSLERWFIKREIACIRRMSSFVVLTDAMCDIINPGRKKPYIVMEGIVDSDMKDKEPTPYQDGKRHITYTGTLESRYGVKTMIEAFMQLPGGDLVFDIYGRGPMAEDMPEYMEKDPRIRYHGVVTIDEAVEAQRSSFLLVNPRPTSEEFTKYSFPSKNMEYMATGVPVLTAALPGMPEEYHQFVFIFEDETSAGISGKISEILAMPSESVRKKGLEGKDFVISQKHYSLQAKKVVDLINQS